MQKHLSNGTLKIQQGLNLVQPAKHNFQAEYFGAGGVKTHPAGEDGVSC
jgi:hypothetical protein